MMLPKKHRLSRPEIANLKKNGRLIPSSNFSLLINQAKPPASSCFAFTVSTKLSKKAVVRNKLKRRLRHAVLQLLPQLKPGFAILFLAKKSALSRSYQQLAQEIEKVFQRISLIESDLIK